MPFQTRRLIAFSNSTYHCPFKLPNYMMSHSYSPRTYNYRISLGDTFIDEYWSYFGLPFGIMNRTNLAPTFYFYVLFRVWLDIREEQCDNFPKLKFIFSSLFTTISSRRPNGVYIRGGRSINPWFRSADNKLLLIKCSSTYKLKPQFMSRETSINISNQKKRVERTFRRRSG